MRCRRWKADLVHDVLSHEPIAVLGDIEGMLPGTGGANHRATDQFAGSVVTTTLRGTWPSSFSASTRFVVGEDEQAEQNASTSSDAASRMI